MINENIKKVDRKAPVINGNDEMMPKRNGQRPLKNLVQRKPLLSTAAKIRTDLNRVFRTCAATPTFADSGALLNYMVYGARGCNNSFLDQLNKEVQKSGTKKHSNTSSKKKKNQTSTFTIGLYERYKNAEFESLPNFSDDHFMHANRQAANS